MVRTTLEPEALNDCLPLAEGTLQDVEVFDSRKREPIKLSMQHRPFCITFGYYEDGSIILLDSTVLKEQCRGGEVIKRQPVSDFEILASLSSEVNSRSVLYMQVYLMQYTQE